MRSLSSLGQNSDFSDVELGDEFPPPDGSINVPGDIIDIVGPMAFSLEDTVFNLAHGIALRWDGCDEDHAGRGGYNSHSQCGRAFFHPGFSEHLNDHFFICLASATLDAGYEAPAYVFINHLGSYNDRNARNSGRLSNHAYARALDIAFINLYDSQGNHTRFSTWLRDYNGANAVFYDSFRQCWMDSLPESCQPGQTEYSGSIGHASSDLGGNSLHNDHIHLSYPLCAG